MMGESPPYSHFSRPASLTTSLIHVSGATRNRMKEVQSDQNWATSLQEDHMAQLHLCLEHRYGPKDLASLQSLGSIHFYKDHGACLLGTNPELPSWPWDASEMKKIEFTPIQTPPHSSSLCSLSYWFLSDSLGRAKREGKPQRYLPCPRPGKSAPRRSWGRMEAK